MNERAFKRVFLPGAVLVLLLLVLVFVLARVFNSLCPGTTVTERDFESDQARIERLQYFFPVTMPHGVTGIKFEIIEWLDVDMKGTFNVPSDMLAGFVASLRKKCHVIETTDKTVRFSFSKINIPPSKSDEGERIDGEIEVKSDTGCTTISCASRHPAIPTSQGEMSKRDGRTTPYTFGDRKTDSSDMDTQSHSLP